MSRKDVNILCLNAATPNHRKRCAAFLLFKLVFENKLLYSETSPLVIFYDYLNCSFLQRVITACPYTLVINVENCISQHIILIHNMNMIMGYVTFI